MSTLLRRRSSDLKGRREGFQYARAPKRLLEPSKQDLLDELAEAVKNTAAIETSEETI